ncbi:hypothetical protein D3C77_760290 [compost metagenome]
MLLLAHQVDGLLALRLHALDERAHQQLRIAFALMGGVDHDRHDHHVGRRRVMADQFLEGFVGHDHVMGTATVDEADGFTLGFEQ